MRHLRYGHGHGHGHGHDPEPEEKLYFTKGSIWETPKGDIVEIAEHHPGMGNVRFIRNGTKMRARAASLLGSILIDRGPNRLVYYLRRSDDGSYRGMVCCWDSDFRTAQLFSSKMEASKSAARLHRASFGPVVHSYDPDTDTHTPYPFTEGQIASLKSVKELFASQLRKNTEMRKRAILAMILCDDFNGLWIARRSRGIMGKQKLGITPIKQFGDIDIYGSLDDLVTAKMGGHADAIYVVEANGVISNQ